MLSKPVTRAVSAAGLSCRRQAAGSISGLLRFQEGNHPPDELFRAEAGVERSLQQKPINGGDRDECPDLRIPCLRVPCAASRSVRWVRKAEDTVARSLRSSASCVAATSASLKRNHLQMVGLEVKAEEKGQQSLSEVRCLQRLPEGPLSETVRALACGARRSLSMLLTW